MIKSYFKIAWRNLLRNKGYSFINISGLALGMTVSILIGLWIYDELTFNTHFRNYDRVAQVMHDMVNQLDLTLDQEHEGAVKACLIWQIKAALAGGVLTVHHGPTDAKL